VKTNVKAFVIGNSGSGKTHFCSTFPKSFWIMTEPDGYCTVEFNPELQKNTVKHNYVLQSPIKDVKQVFSEIDALVKEAYVLAYE